jgi:NitT/TauT family transport system permease protein
VLRTVVWPGIRSHVLTGLRLAVDLAWLILAPAEMLGVDSGLGYFILNTRDRLAYGDLMAAILAVGACGFVIDSAARWALRARRRRPPTRVDVQRLGELAGGHTEES